MAGQRVCASAVHPADGMVPHSEDRRRGLRRLQARVSQAALLPGTDAVSSASIAVSISVKSVST